MVNMLPAIRLMRLWLRALIPELRDHLDVQPTTKGSWIHLSGEGRQACGQPSDASTPTDDNDDVASYQADEGATAGPDSGAPRSPRRPANH